MSREPSPRPRLAHAVAVALPLGLALLVTIQLAWSSWDARADHRRSAERTVRDYADFAAALVGREAEALLDQTLLYAFYAADLAERRGDTTPVHPRALADNPPEADRCGRAYPDGRWFARLGAGAGTLESVGPLSPELARWLLEALAPLVSGGEGPRTGNLFPPASGHTGVVAFRVRRDATGRPLEVHAIAHCFEVREADGDGFRSAFAPAGAPVPLLPPALVAPLPRDSLLSVAVTAPDGGEVYRSGAAWGGPFPGVHRPVGGALDGLEIGVALRPDLGERLVAGGMPASRLPTTLALVLLAGALLAATLVQAVRSLELARARERFVADVSHELRTPLQQILIFVQLLRLGRLPNEHERADALDVVERETHRLIRLVERLLAFSRPVGAQRAPGSPATSAVAAVLDEAIAAFQPQARHDGTELELQLDDPALVVAVDPEALRQLVGNVLDNALKYGPPGQRVRVRATHHQGRARVTVDDEGPGIPPEERERVWRPFHRLEREAGTAVTGTGIGLAVARRILDEAGGRGALEASPGGGTRVVLELPLAPPGGGRDGRS